MKRPIAAAVVAAAAALAACLTLPSYRGPNLVTYTEDAGGVTVTVVGSGSGSGSGFKLHFAGGDNFHFPDSLKIDGVEVMGSDRGDGSSTCYDQSGTGIKIAPTPRINGDGTAKPLENQLTPVLRGPVVVQLRLDWTTQFTCAPHATPGGTSTFTVFPDGRIVRHDQLRDPNEHITADNCSCATPNPGAFSVSAFWTFAQTPFKDPLNDLLGVIDTDQLGGLLQTGETRDNFNHEFDTICLDAQSYQVASTWVRPVPGGTTRTPAAVGGTPALLEHQVEKPFGSSTLDLPWDVHGALFIERTGCMAAVKRVNQHFAQSILTINALNNDIKTMASPLDGMYGGDLGDGKTGVEVGSDHATLTGTVPGPFAVWLRFTPDPLVPRAKISGATPPDGAYEPQRNDDGSWILWFRDSLADGQMITIAP